MSRRQQQQMAAQLKNNTESQMMNISVYPLISLVFLQVSEITIMHMNKWLVEKKKQATA